MNYLEIKLNDVSSFFTREQVREISLVLQDMLLNDEKPTKQCYGCGGYGVRIYGVECTICSGTGEISVPDIINLSDFRKK